MTRHYNEEIAPSVYSDVIESALTAGRTAADINETVLSNPGVALIGEDLVRQAYATGAEVAAEEMIYEEKNSASMTKGVTFGTGTFTDRRQDKSTAIGGLKTLEVIAKVTGLDVELTDDENVVGGENGHFAPSRSTVYLNAEQAHRLAGTAYHESFGEFAATWNQKEYAGTVNSILAAAQKHYGAAKYNAIRNQYVAKYKAVEETKTDIDLDKEMANDLLYKFFEDEEGMQELIDEIDRQNGAKEAKSIKQKLAEWLKKLADSIRDFMATFTPNEFQRGIAEANLEHIESLRKEVMKTVAGAVRNYNEARAQAEQTRAIEEGKGSIDAQTQSEIERHSLDTMAEEAVSGEVVRRSEDIEPKEIELSADDMNKNVHAVHNMKSIGTFEFDNGEIRKGLHKNAEDLMQRFRTNHESGILQSEAVGAVNVSIGGIKETLNHSNWRARQKFFPAVIATIEKGKIVAADQNHKSKNYNTVVLAAPVTMNGESNIDGVPAGDYYVAVSLKRKVVDGKITQGLHVDDFLAINKNEGSYAVLGNLADINKGLPSSYASLVLHQILENIRDDVNIYERDSEKYRFSVDIDSEGSELTPAQQKYFADSKVRDEDGRLKVMYHGSNNAGFTIFNPAQSDDHRSLFFTDSPSVAESYSDTGVEFRPDGHYSFDELSEALEGLFDGGWRLARNGDSIGIINEDEDVVFTGSADEVRDELIDLRSEAGLRGPGNYKVYLNLENPYVYDARGKQWNRLRAPEYDRDVRHEYKSIESFFNPDVNKYSVIGTTVEGEKEYLVRLMTLDEVEAKYGPAFRNLLEDSDYAAQPRTNVDRAIDYDMGFDDEWRPLDNRYTTRKVARYAEENGYDGVIFKNIIDIGKYGWSKEPSTVAVAFRKDQVKTVDNKNPSFAVDIRYAIGIDETWNDDLDWSAESEVIQSDLSEALQSGNEILKGTTVNKADVKKIARRISAHYGSRINVDEFADTLTKVFAYAQQQDYINYDDLATVISEVAYPVIERSVNRIWRIKGKASHS